jgi:hypothetical protein
VARPKEVEMVAGILLAVALVAVAAYFLYLDTRSGVEVIHTRLGAVPRRRQVERKTEQRRAA